MNVFFVVCFIYILASYAMQVEFFLFYLIYVHRLFIQAYIVCACLVCLKNMKLTASEASSRQEYSLFDRHEVDQRIYEVFHCCFIFYALCKCILSEGPFQIINV